MSPRLSASECWRRLGTAGHGVLATRHPLRGVDAVPVVYAVDTWRIVLPIDTVKAKRTTDLQRIANLANDPRCVLLVDHYDDDWAALWWVRVHAPARVVLDGSFELEELAELLRTRFTRYAAAGSVVGAIVLDTAVANGSGAWGDPTAAEHATSPVQPIHSIQPIVTGWAARKIVTGWAAASEQGQAPPPRRPSSAP